jgi:hypothetical protein
MGYFNDQSLSDFGTIGDYHNDRMLDARDTGLSTFVARRDPSLPQPTRPSTADLLAAAAITVVPHNRVWRVLLDGREVCWMLTQDEAETVGYELACELIAEGLIDV